MAMPTPPPTHEQHGWSCMPGDILDLIFERLLAQSWRDITDELAAGAVCAWWRAALLKHRRSAAGSRRVEHLAPWLLLDGRAHEEGGDVGYFHDLRRRRTHAVAIPGPGVNDDFLFVGSSHGWLVAADRSSNLHALNTITRAVVPLPPAATLQGIEPVLVGVRADIACYYVKERLNVNGKRYKWATVEKVAAGKLHYRRYKKVVLSSDPSAGGECTAVLVEKNLKHFSFARADRAFVYLDCVHHDGRFYTVTDTGAVEAWDLCRPDLARAPAPETVVRHGARSENRRYLVSAPWGDLLLVQKPPVACSDEEPSFSQQRRDVIMVDRVDLARRRLSPVANLCGYGLLLAPHGDAVWVAAHELPGLGENCICFAAARKDWTLYCAGVYDLDAGTIQPLDASLESFMEETGDHPIWITRKVII
ncbi:hypothetical protein ACP70R_028871 [Stipagrostis hirtigluma subsp. patula]